MKTNALNRKAIEHLQLIGYQLTGTIEEMCDAPYLYIQDDTVSTGYSALELITQERVLKLRPINEKQVVKEQPKKAQKMYKLLAILNSAKNSNLTGYDVSWTIQKCLNDKYRYEILPISPFACGSISMEHLAIILEFAKANQEIHASISYTGWNDEKKRYGTYTPCIRLS